MSGSDAAILAAIIDASDDAIVTKTLDGIIMSWNPAAERLFGYRADEAIGQPITILFPPDRLDEEVEFRRLIRAGQRVEHFETVRVRKDGTLVDISVTLSPIPDEMGRPIAISKIARNITARKRTESRLGAQENLLRMTLASIGDAVITTDQAGRVTFLNPIGEELTGWTDAEARGRPLSDVFQIVNELSGHPVEDPTSRALREGIVVGLANHTVLIDRAGVRHPIDDSAAPIRDESGRIFGAVLVFRDVSARRKADEAMQRLAAIVDSSDDAIVSKTIEGIVTSWNGGAQRIFGYTASEMIGRPITTLFPPDRLGEEADFMERIGRGQRVEHFDTIRVRKTGELIHVSVTLSPIRAEDGRIVGVSKIARDIGERVELAERERAARREAEEASRVKDEFLATLSHELRTPLTSIFGWARLLRSGSLEPGAVDRAIEVIERNCRTQVDLINDLLDISRIITGRMALNLRPLGIDQVVRAATESIRPAAMAKRIALEVTLGPTSRVLGDPSRLQQIVWNLLSNAVKFTGEGGRVDLAIRQEGSHVTVTVSDTGVGIDPELLPHVFDRFRQADSSMTRQHGGLGLGLAIVRHLVELHGGTVRASSAGAGQGASFTVSLPVTSMPEQKPARAPAPAAARAVTLRGSRILVVDDDPDALAFVGEVLRRAGSAVFTAVSAAEALIAIVSHRPTMILTDLGMPDEDGFSLLHRIRRLDDPELRRIPAVALTAYASAADRQLAIASGFQGHLVKPVDPVELVNAVSAAMRAG
jgi:PAS domain S-box-containing protein